MFLYPRSISICATNQLYMHVRFNSHQHTAYGQLQTPVELPATHFQTSNNKTLDHALQLFRTYAGQANAYIASYGY